MARKLRELVREQREAQEDSTRLEALLEELSAQEPYLEYTKASWGRCRQQAGLELQYATVLARLYPGSLCEEAVELKSFHQGSLGEPAPCWLFQETQLFVRSFVKGVHVARLSR